MSHTRIAGLHGRRVWDSCGRPTVEGELRLAGGTVGRAIAPAGASTGSGEAIELREDTEARAAQLLPALLLGRVDGKSPVEYITEEADKERVRKVARFLLTERAERLDTVRDAWAAEL